MRISNENKSRKHNDLDNDEISKNLDTLLQDSHQIFAD